MKRYFLLFLSFVLIISLVTLVFTKKRRNKPLITLLIIFLVAVIGFSYTSNLASKKDDSSVFGVAKEHRYTVNNYSFYLPLPKRTTFRYRTTDTKAFYETRTPIDKIINFYENIAEEGTYYKMEVGKEVKLFFKYKDSFIVISIEQQDEICMFSIE